jgi:hypothetical protein
LKTAASKPCLDQGCSAASLHAALRATGLQRAIAPPGKLTEYPVHCAGSAFG